ncbi:pyridoxine 5'-phosphate oxidase C-terminal domain-containing protein [Mycobacterium sp. AZCC_0083]|uniref:pyridoxine 5'-phosphate oxidase C-terminal domain-containing protein n=1 Tax=Mycobacterium sp. AZCC_0083 TaxID=2735882 RepID=UPI00210758FA|nr:pyridoxine 5'-phosphate oxidase C-terminal domain-containing protein [Mycobacterium sp. AZCC_0083]
MRGRCADLLLATAGPSGPRAWTRGPRSARGRVGRFPRQVGRCARPGVAAETEGAVLGRRRSGPTRWQGVPERRHQRLLYTRSETGWSKSLLWP